MSSVILFIYSKAENNSMGKRKSIYIFGKLLYSEMNISHTKNLEVVLIIGYELRYKIMHFVATFEWVSLLKGE